MFGSGEFGKDLLGFWGEGGREEGRVKG